MIRKLIPTGLGNDRNTRGVNTGDATCYGSSADYMEECGPSQSRDQVPDSFNETENMHTVSGSDTCQDGDKQDSSFRCEQPCVPTGEEAWEEHGCVLWDLAASKTHAELMVLESVHFCLISLDVLLFGQNKRERANLKVEAILIIFVLISIIFMTFSRLMFIA